MRAFTCGHCGFLIFFENTACLRCGSALAFSWTERDMVTGSPAGDGDGWSRCANQIPAACNWLAPAPGELCFNCSLTRTRPADDDAAGTAAFAEAEGAKRWLLFELGELGLPIPSWRDTEGGFAFDLLSSAHAPVTTGHADGVVTLDLAETDDAHRARTRQEMGEPYRTTLGHFRHEIGHAYFPLLTAAPDALDLARAAFGDEQEDYQAALARHYAQGPPADWADAYVSAYATMHPAEDWAETFAHVLHIRDTLQTAAAYGLKVQPPPDLPDDLASEPSAEPAALRTILDDWLPLTYAVTGLNRSMGQDALYPFVLPPAVIDKLALADALVRRAAAGG